MKKLLLWAGALVIAASMAALNVRANAQQPQTQQPTAAQQPNDMSSQDAKPMSGTIVKEKGKLVLKDSATSTTFNLDDQEKAKQFEGKQVKVTGKLNSSTNEVHVESIEPAQP